MKDNSFTRLRRFLARTREGFERLEAIQFAAPWRPGESRPTVCGPGQA
ncbi:MAG: hypothetical protein ACK40O_13695 [Allosphingosinicella sp.]